MILLKNKCVCKAVTLTVRVRKCFLYQWVKIKHYQLFTYTYQPLFGLLVMSWTPLGI